MKKSTKIDLIIAAVIILVGIILAVIGFALGGDLEDVLNFKTNANKSELLETAEISLDVKNINIDHSFKVTTGKDDDLTDVEIVSGDKFAVSYYGNENSADFSYEITGDTLNIEIVEKHQLISWGFFDFFDNDAKVIISVPTGQELDSVNVKAAVEDLEIKNVTLGKLDVNFDVGNIEITNCQIVGVDITADVGNVEIENSTLGEAQITVDIGNIDVENCSLDMINCTANIGDIDISVVGFAREYCAVGYADVGTVEIDKNIVTGYVQGLKQIFATADIGSVDINLE
ncbi:MAG: DUF4097 family beta strand repeat-containing protein [Bacillota bacterium]